ncbi:MAG: exodeoxyribonuclease VII large subunit [Thermoplasmata archaeon]|nr:MAG: exodeoxyribonuclease VII large subunit [Thermoplasmata archaeon]
MFEVKELTLYIKNKLTSDTSLVDIWVKGEVSNFVHHTSGHFYFTLKDENSQLPCAMFRWANEALKFKLEEGMKIIARGSIDLYIPSGRYNFVVSEVQPKGIGELYLRFLQLKEKLAKEGLFNVEFKKPIPRFPKRVSIITSPTGAAIQDIINIMKRRFPATEVLVVPTLVQGENAKEDIVNSIQLINKFEDVDVAIVGRGGGSIEDLWPFNEEIVARAIFNSQVPIVSAVGHETDFTISDFVADLRAPTPSAAAELVVPDKREVIRQIEGLKDALLQNLSAMSMMHEKQLEGIRKALRPGLLIDRVIQYQQRTDDLILKLLMRMEHNLELINGRLNSLAEMLDAVSPLATLKRGYSITQRLPEETTLDSVKKVKMNDKLKVILQDGELKCTVDYVKKNDKEKMVKPPDIKENEEGI